MAIVNTKSTIVTNADATPKVMTRGAIGAGRRRGAVATVEVAAADDNNSVYRFFRVHSSWIITELWLYNDAITSGSSYDCGLYRTADDGGAVVDADCWATAVTMVSARTGTAAPLNLVFEALNIDKVEKTVWEVAAIAVTTITADPAVWYDICLTANTVGSGAGTISMVLGYLAP